MEFRTEIPIQVQTEDRIDYRSQLLFFGSCFSDLIGQRFEDLEFLSSSNPFGVLFHPKAIERLIGRTVNQEFFSEDELIKQDGLYCALDVHSQFNHRDAEHVLSDLNDLLSSTLERLKEASHIFITLGTAWAYRYIPTNSLVANCHKIPQNQFIKELLSVDAVKESLEAITDLIRTVNQKAIIILTISPVRHLKDGFVENTRSKSHLIAATHQVLESLEGCYYFPSYELLMDELRDYRFYGQDMIHPSDMAVTYVWERLLDTWLDPAAITLYKEVLSLRKGQAHRVMDPESKTAVNFKKALEFKQSEIALKIKTIRSRRR